MRCFFPETFLDLFSLTAILSGLKNLDFLTWSMAFPTECVEAYKLCKQGDHRIAEFGRWPFWYFQPKTGFLSLFFFFLRNMDFWICFPSQQFWVGVEMGRGSKNITLCILCPSTQRWGRTGGTLGVFPIWENYAILQTQKYHPSHRKSHGGAGGKIEFFSNEDICKFVFKILADGWICFKCFCWISPPAPDYISWLMVVKGDEQRRNLCMAAFVDFCFQFDLYLYFFYKSVFPYFLN